MNYQQLVIKEQNDKLNNLAALTSILEKYTNPDDIEKLLKTKERLLLHDLEALRRRTINEVNETLSKEWGTVIERVAQPEYNEVIEELYKFVLTYLSLMKFQNTTERNGFIRSNFPKKADLIIQYLDTQAKQKDKKKI